MATGHDARLLSAIHLLGAQVGIDLALSVDYTAVCVTKVYERVTLAPDALETGHLDSRVASLKDALALALERSGRRETYYVVQNFARWPHTLSAQQTASALTNLLANIKIVVFGEYGASIDNNKVRLDPSNQQPPPPPVPPPSVAVFADSTGLGRPMVQLFAEAIEGNPLCSGIELYPLTFTHGESYDRSRGVVGKTHLISRLQALLATGLLDLPASNVEAPALRQEIAMYRYAISQNGTETWGGVSATHDDLVTSLALSVVDNPQDYRVRQGTWRPFLR